VPAAAINALRRDVIAAHEAARLKAWQRTKRMKKQAKCR